MRILLLTHAFNGLTQRLFCALREAGHQVSVELDIADSVSEEAVRLFQPELIVAPFLKRAIPENIWARHTCLIVHPGVPGDRGPHALDWAIQDGKTEWGVTVLQAEAEMDAGPVWASVSFPMRPGRKSSLYREEVTEAALEAVLMAVARFASGSFVQERVAGMAHPRMTPALRQMDWQQMGTQEILARIWAADGFPGVSDELFGVPCQLFDAWPEAHLHGEPGVLLARRETAVCRATKDGAVWIGHVQRGALAACKTPDKPIKLPTTLAFPEAASLPERPLPEGWAPAETTWQDITYRESAGVGYLSFEFYNGAMSARQCRRLTEAFEWAARRPTQVIVLTGGRDYWSNGIHLNVIEAADSPADASWENINAIDDLAEAILRCASHLTVAAVGASAGAGGCFLARACDEVWVRDGVILNPHYKNMGNLYGSEFWTYLLPARVGEDGAQAIMQHRLPMTAAESVHIGFYDQCLPRVEFAEVVAVRAQQLAADTGLTARLAAKNQRRMDDEARRPLAEYRAQELAHMHRNFYGFDPSYHVARYHFVNKSPHSWTPRHLALHRELDWNVPA